MRTANIGILKNQLSAFLRLVRNGEEVIVCDRNVPVARILPFRAEQNFESDEAALIAAGVMTPPKNPNPIDWDTFWAVPTGEVADEAIKEAVNWAKGELCWILHFGIRVQSFLFV